jgi:hypothetical protein
MDVQYSSPRRKESRASSLHASKPFVVPEMPPKPVSILVVPPVEMET